MADPTMPEEPTPEMIEAMCIASWGNGNDPVAWERDLAALPRVAESIRSDMRAIYAALRRHLEGARA